jgi:hypothetical protein
MGIDGRLGVLIFIVRANGSERNVGPVPAKLLAVEVGAKPAGGTRGLRRAVGFHGQFGTPSLVAECTTGRHYQNKPAYPSDDRHRSISPRANLQSH